MKPTTTNPYTTHDNISLLLPWYVNNTLQSTELKDVESHLKVCLTCKRELANLKKLSFAVNQEGSFDSAALASYSHLKDRINQNENINTPFSNVKMALISKKKPFLDRTKFAMVAMLVLAIVVPGYVNLGKLVSGDYRTLSNSETSKPQKNEIRIVFSEGLKQKQIDAIVSKVHGQIVSGPNEKSVYTVQINQGNTTKNILETLEQLRENTNIIFAEPAYDLLSSMQTEGGPKI